MAQLRDVPKVLRNVGLFAFIKRVYLQMNDDQILVWAAALAYSWLFSIFPFLIFLLTLVPYLPSRYTDAAVSGISEQVYQALPENAAQATMREVHAVVDNRAQGLLSIGLLITIWVASGGMSMTMYALDKCYDVEEGRAFFYHRSLAILLTIVCATLVILVVVLMPIATAVLAWMRTVLAREAEDLGIMPYIDTAANIGLILIALIVVLAIVFFVGPRRGRRHTRPGVAVAMAAFLIIIALAIFLMKPGDVPLLPWISASRQEFGSLGFIILDLVRYALALLLMLMILAIIYHFGPSIRRRFHVITPGAVFSFAVWILLILAFRFYINNFGWESYQRTYGTVGLAAILLLFFYLFGVVLLLGAEINSEIDFAIVGIPSGPTDEEQAVAQVAQDEEEQELAEEIRAKRDPSAPAANDPPADATTI
jgi:YihY family inner membrane protein